jgi:uncharacterized protein
MTAANAPERRTAIAELTRRLVDALHPEQVILFGSHARGDTHRWSDVDLLVVVPDGSDARAARSLALDATRGVTVEYDLVVSTPSELRRQGALVGTILRPALRDGVLLYDAAGAEQGLIELGNPVTQEQVAHATRHWISLARDDLQSAELLLATSLGSPRNACYLAQQAAEKALKAIYVFVQVQYPFTHDLDALRNGLPSGWSVTAAYPDLKALSDLAIVGRYPNPGVAMPTPAQAAAALARARGVLEAVTADLAARGLELDAT